MAILEINGIEYKGKCNFAFDQFADDKYNDTDPQGDHIGGFTSIYTKLMDDDLKGLLAFWDCACAEYGKKRPSVKEIGDTLMAIIDDEENGEEEVEKLFKEAFKAIHNSGFYRKKAKKPWTQFQKMEMLGDTPGEVTANKETYREMLEAKEALLQ